MHAPGAERGLKRISVLVPVEHCDRLTRLAEVEHRTFSQELRRLIEQRVADADQDAAEALAT